MNKFRFGFLKIMCLVCCLIFLAASCDKPSTGPYNEGTIEIGGKKISIEVAETEQDKITGLSGRASIGEGQALLFPYDQAFIPGIWMKGMNFPIDIIWIKDGTIVDIDANAETESRQFDSQFTVYKPSSIVDNILEVKAGFAERQNLKIGDKVIIKIK